MPSPVRTLVLVTVVLLGTLVLPGTAEAQEGSAGAAVVGGLAGGVATLWAFHGLSGCPVVKVGAARDTDGCDVGGLASALGGLGAGVWIGAGDSGAGYGVGVGTAAGFGLSLLLGRVTDTPRWLDAALVLGGAVLGGVLGGER